MEAFRARQFAKAGAVPNTFIGGIAKQGGIGVNAPIDTPYKLSQKLGIAVNRITGFKVIGDDVECRIRGSYTIPTNAFQNNTNLTYFIDADKLMQAIENGSFQGSTNLSQLSIEGITRFSNGGGQKISSTKIETLNFPQVSFPYGNNSIQNNSLLKTVLMPISRESASFGGAQWLTNNPNLELVDLRSMRFIGRTTPLRGSVVFTGSGKVGTILKVHQAVQSVVADGGGLDINVNYAKNTRGWIIELYDDNGDYVSTL